jgi:hypothetical protein
MRLPRAAEVLPTVSQVREQLSGAASETNFLERLLGIQEAPVNFYGWIQNSFTGNTNGTPRNRSNFSVFPNRLANQWQGNQLPYLIAENPVDLNDTFNIGFRFDFLFGNDWQFSKAYGLFDKAFPVNHFAGIDLPQFFGEIHLPILTPYGLDIRGGRFYAPSGFESVQAIRRPLLSVPYLFNFTPFTYFGFVCTLHVTTGLNLVSGAVEGGDRIFDESYHYSYLGGYNWASQDSKTAVASYILVGPNQLPSFPPLDTPILPTGVQQSPPGLEGRRNPLYAHHPRTYFDMVISRKWTEKLTQADEVFFIIDSKVPFQNRVVKDSSWYGSRTGSFIRLIPPKNSRECGGPRYSTIHKEAPRAFPRSTTSKRSAWFTSRSHGSGFARKRGTTGLHSQSHLATERAAASSPWRSM